MSQKPVNSVPIWNMKILKKSTIHMNFFQRKSHLGQDEVQDHKMSFLRTNYTQSFASTEFPWNSSLKAKKIAWNLKTVSDEEVFMCFSTHGFRVFLTRIQTKLKLNSGFYCKLTALKTANVDYVMFLSYTNQKLCSRCY